MRSVVDNFVDGGCLDGVLCMCVAATLPSFGLSILISFLFNVIIIALLLYILLYQSINMSDTAAAVPSLALPHL